jgi:glycosyltransferase involved in cell wall biosynthesis
VKVLLSAYFCAPGHGSEHWVGWNWAVRLAARHDVWVLTSAVTEREILASPEHARAHWVFLRPPLRPQRFPLLNWLRHYAWQLLASRRAAALHREIGFDVVHHVTIASWRLPSLLWRLGAPLVWGPVGGGQDVPPGFAPLLGPAGRLRELTRGVSQALSRYDPLVRRTLRQAHRVFAANRPTQAVLAGMGRAGVERMLETAIDPTPAPPARRPDRGGPLRILWIGTFMPRKGLPLLLRALAQVRAGVAWQLDVIGDGPERRRWMRVTDELRLTDRVRFHGRLPYAETQARYADADVLAFPSLRDTSGNVLLEAMGAGLPVVALAWSGTPEIVTEECGILISPDSPAAAAAGFAAALERLAASPELRRRLGEAGRRRVEACFSWPALVDRMLAVYEESAGGSGAGPAAGREGAAAASAAHVAATSAPSSGAQRKLTSSGELTPRTR